ncbi:MAG: ImmA/IrrE family metallo-endopeptidase [Dehalococcoidia bacterium]
MLRRGFKTRCEKLSSQVRADLDVRSDAPLSFVDLARYMRVELRTPEDIDGIPPKTLLVLKDQAAEWSAAAVSIGDDKAIVYNPHHSLRRQASDVMHELAHILLDHSSAIVVLSPDGQLALRSFDQDQEDEASWLSGCLLLPRSALLTIAARRMSTELACGKYGVSEDLLKFRLNVTGAKTQVRRRVSATTPNR